MKRTFTGALVALGLAMMTAPRVLTQSPQDPGFTMLIASDTQFTWWRGGADPDCPGCTESKGIETNQNMISAMTTIESLKTWPAGLLINGGKPVTAPKGLIINGDLTKDWHPDEFDQYTSFYDTNFRFQIYPGLGNHDYRNNINPKNTCYYENYYPDRFRCAKEAAWWLGRRIPSLPNVVNSDVPGFVSVLNNGGYVARFTVSWTSIATGHRIFTTTDGYGVGQRRGIPLTSDAGFPIEVKIEDFTGVDWKTIVDKDNLDAGRSCFMVDGTSLIPDWHHDSCASSWPSGSAGSMSYSFDIGNVHFVQLNVEPDYAADFPESLAPYLEIYPEYQFSHSPGFTVTPSWVWLAQDLFFADAHGKQSVINMHILEDDDNYSVFKDGNFTNAIAGRNIIAMFGGHTHQDYGALVDSGKLSLRTIDNGVRQIPLFRSGSSECERFLMVDFHQRYFSVGVVSAKNGQAAWVTDKDDVCDPRNFTMDGVHYMNNDDDPRPRTFAINKPPSSVNGFHFGSTVEGAISFFQANGTDPDGDPLTFHWNFGDGQTGTGTAISHLYNHSGTFNVTVTADDGFGGTLDHVFTVSISNVAPTVTATPVAVVDTDTGSISGAISDAGIGDTFTVSVDWGAGGAPQLVDLPAATRTFALSHVYSSAHAPGPQTFQVNVTVTDDGGGVGQTSLPLTVTRGVPPTTIAPLAIGIEPTEAGGARSSNSPALQAFLARAYAIPGSDPHPVAALPTFRSHFGEIPGVFGGFDIDVPIIFSTLLPLGTTPVHFRYVDRHGLASDAFANVTVGPQPHLVVEPSVVTDSSGTWIDLRIRNSGGAAAKNVVVRMVTFRALDGAGLVTLLAPLPPVSIDSLGAGAATDVRARIFISPGVTRFAVNTYAMVTGLAGDVTMVYDATPASR